MIRPLLLTPAAVLICLSACSDATRAPEPAARGAARAAGRELRVADRPLAPFRAELLDLAFKAASAMPLQPHVKNRSRAQAAVVDACFALDQPRRALRYAAEIANWRRGLAFADFAYDCAKRGDLAEVQHHLDLAEQVAREEANDANAQEWRRDRILARIAATHVLLGHSEEAARFGAGVAGAEGGRIEVAKAEVLGPDDFEAQLEWADRVFAAGVFDEVRGAMDVCATLFDRFYADAARRRQAAERIESAYDKLPIRVRIELLMQIAGAALDHGDPTEALALVEKTQALLDAGRWLPEDKVPLAAQLCALRWRSGDQDGATTRLDAALMLYEAARDRIVDVYRAGALRPVAEAWQAMGNTPKAVEIYTRAVAEGVHNPNSRPRADDFCATCCSMAVHGVEPTAALRVRLLEVCDGLGDPW